MSVTAVAFDLDATLAVTTRPRRDILAAATNAVGAPTIAREEYLAAHTRHLDGESRVPIFADLLPDDADATPAVLARAYREAILDALEPVEGAAELLDALRADYRVGLLTNGPVVAQRGKLAELGWANSFDAAVVTGELDAGKPSEHAFDALLADLDADPQEAMYVGDDPEMDVRGASAVGMTAVQVVFPGGPDPDPAADAHVPRDELPSRLYELLQSS